MNYGLPLLSLILYISKPNVGCMELSFHSHTISHLTKNQALIYISIFEFSNFLLKIALQCFLFTNLTIVLSELLSSLWQFSTSFLVIAIFIALKNFFLIFHQGFVEGCPEFQYYFSLYIAQVYCEKFQLQWAFCPTIQLYFSVEHYSLWAVGELAS